MGSYTAPKKRKMVTMIPSGVNSEETPKEILENAKKAKIVQDDDVKMK